MIEELSYRGVKGQSYVIRDIGRSSCWYKYRSILIDKIAVTAGNGMRIVGLSAEEKEVLLSFAENHQWSEDIELLSRNEIHCMSLMAEKIEDPDRNY